MPPEDDLYLRQFRLHQNFATEPYTAWCARRGLEPLPPAPQAIGLYLADLASETGAGRGRTAATVERRLAGLGWTFRQHGFTLDRAERHVREVLAGIRRAHGRPPGHKEALLGSDVTAMAALLGPDLRDRALLLLGFAGGLRRSELFGLDHGPDETPEATGWVEVLEAGLLLRVRGKTGWREVEVGRGRVSGISVLPHFAWIRRPGGHGGG